MYAAEQVIPYVIELNSSREGFQPRYDLWRDKTVERNRAGWQLLLDRLDGAGVRGTLKDKDGSPILNYNVLVYKSVNGVESLFQTYRSNPDGTFHIILNPGAYNLKFKAASRSELNMAVSFLNERVEIDAQLQ